MYNVISLVRKLKILIWALSKKPLKKYNLAGYEPNKSFLLYLDYFASPANIRREQDQAYLNFDNPE
jgi:hypothetical protein